MARKKKAPAATTFPTEHVPTDSLTPHPRNYRQHGPEQLAHVVESIRANGFYRNIVIAQDDVILAGHGVVMAAREMDLETVPVIRLPVDHDSPEALRVLTGDNEIAKLGVVDDRALTELLRDVHESIDGLLGTGYDERMLAALTFVTRPKDEIETVDHAAHWAGMPEFGGWEEPFKLIVNFRTEDDRKAFIAAAKLDPDQITTSKNKTDQTWWPPRERDDLQSLKFTQKEAAEAELPS